MPERYVIQVWESYEYDKDGKLLYYLYFPINSSTAHAFNIRNKDTVIVKVHKIRGSYAEKYEPITEVNTEYPFEVYEYASRTGDQMVGLKISTEFVNTVGVREGDYIDLSLVSLKQMDKLVPIYPDAIRWGFRPYGFQD
ncbi:MAG: hypothetical protein M0Z77_07605 [Thermoplasmatales archaeon]|nr:hypothetical protein [Thermoplasmatales archaeon]